MAPIGFVGQVQVATHLDERVAIPGDCPASVSEFAVDWDRYEAGVTASPEVSSAGAAPRPGPDRGADRRFHG